MDCKYTDNILNIIQAHTSPSRFCRKSEWVGAQAIQAEAKLSGLYS